MKDGFIVALFVLCACLFGEIGRLSRTKTPPEASKPVLGTAAALWPCTEIRDGVYELRFSHQPTHAVLTNGFWVIRFNP